MRDAGRGILVLAMIAAFGAWACESQGGTSVEEDLVAIVDLDSVDPDTDDPDARDTDTGEPDTGEPDADGTLGDATDTDTTLGDIDVAEDLDAADAGTRDMATLDGDAIGDATAPCEGPVTMTPTTADGAGYDTVFVSGGEFYIGALEWWLLIDDETWVGVDYGQVQPPAGNCVLPFTLPPLPAGTYEVSVFYGFPPTVTPDPAMPTGTLTITEPTGPWSGATPCNVDADCADGTECHVGLGFCAPLNCPAAWCGETRTCDPLQGCVDAPPCDAANGCELLYTSCGCVATHSDDPRLDTGVVTDCRLGACEVCVTNRCTPGFEAVCDGARQRCSVVDDAP